MSPDFRQRADDERALLWLKRRLEWEELFAALRETGGRRRVEPACPQEEPAAA